MGRKQTTGKVTFPPHTHTLCFLECVEREKEGMSRSTVYTNKFGLDGHAIRRRRQGRNQETINTIFLYHLR